ncbi:dynein axonemal assembly factor 6 [Gastrophryne carolinensis]
MEQGDFSSTSIKYLCDLLNNSAEEEDETESQNNLPSVIAGPGDIGPIKTLEHKSSTGQTKTHNKDIWNTAEVQEGSEFDDSLDPREQPEYEIHFKQRVGSEDIFLGMSRKDPSTACCEDIAVHISLPGTKASDVCLDVRKKYLALRTPKYKLGLHLPHPVNEKSGKAKFIVDTETLEVTLPLLRDFDFINFA